MVYIFWNFYVVISSHTRGEIKGGKERMKYFKAFTVIALSVSLFVNFNLLSKLNDLENRINSISSYQSQVISSVNSQSNNIRNIINDIKKEQSWLSPISIATKTTDIDQGKAVVDFEWQVKELKDNSKVVFNYKMGDEKEYTAINAVKMESGLFKAAVPIEVTLEPEWRIKMNDRSKGEEAQKERAVREKKIEENNRYNQLSINYFVSVTNNDIMKSSNINNTRIKNLGVKHYGLIETYTYINNNSYSVSVVGFPIYNETSKVLKEVYLKKYKNGKYLDEEKLVSDSINKEGIPTRENALNFHTEPSDEKLDCNSLVVKVIYNDGAAFEKEIYFR